MRFLFINPPIRESGPPKHYPLGLCLIGAVLDEAGYEVAIIDANAYRLNREQVRVEARELVGVPGAGTPLGGRTWDCIGIGNLITTYGWQKDVIKGLRQDFPNTPIIAGGGCATALGAQMLEWIPELDAVVIGEAEKTILEIAKNNANFEGIKGVVYRDKNPIKTIRFNAPVELMTEEELDQLPFPKWDLAPLEEVYFKNSGVALSKESLFAQKRLDFEATRGCPYICNFCTDMPTGNSRTGYSYRLKFRKHSPKYVADMLAKARFKYGIDFALFVDENFDVDRKWVFALCDALEDAELIGLVYWGATAHVNTVTPDLLARMRSCGCAYLDYGMESGSDTILRYIKKNATRERNQQALNWSIKALVNPLTNFMMGQPIETVQTVYDTASFIKKNGIIVKPFFSTPYPATELYYTQMDKLIKKYGDLESFILALGDATDLTVNLTQFNDAELFGLRELVARHDLKAILEFAKTKNEKIIDPETGKELTPGEVAKTEPPVPLANLKMLEDKDYGMKQEWIEEMREKHIQAGWAVNPPKPASG
jgi:anaerobic magnesium-protoporphyrin IX monomethyl ester cyclase